MTSEQLIVIWILTRKQMLKFTDTSQIWTNNNPMEDCSKRMMKVNRLCDKASPKLNNLYNGTSIIKVAAT